MSDPSASTTTGTGQTHLEVTGVVPAPPERAFALLADPDRHPELDGSGMIRASGTHLAITELGDVFVMHMHHQRFGDYDMDNVVTVYEPDQAIGWSPAPPGGEPVGHTWTWRLEPTADDSTAVTHTYDWSGVTEDWLLEHLPVVSREQMQESLRRLAELLA
jgi:uncharacterized protein YndB with AHSA1/START domain